MSEEQNNKDLPVATEKEKDEVEALPKEGRKVFSRRQALLGALFGAGAVLAKTAKAAEASCACLAPPDCDAICPNGGTPRGDGTQACDCNAEAKETLAKVAYTGSYEDLTNKPTISALEDIVTAGTTGQASDVTMKGIWTRYTGVINSSYSSSSTTTDSINQFPTGTFKVPYFTVDKKGRITAYGSKTITISQEMKTKYYNYGNYSDNCSD